MKRRPVRRAVHLVGSCAPAVGGVVTKMSGTPSKRRRISRHAVSIALMMTAP
ncbi:hypothetical protein [Streptomyces sp. NPDC001880]